MIELDRTLPFVDAVFRTADDSQEIDAAARLLNEIESRRHVRLHYMSDVITEELNDDQWCKIVFFPFLTETQLIISGGDLLNLVEVLRDDGNARRSHDADGAIPWPIGPTSIGYSPGAGSLSVFWLLCLVFTSSMSRLTRLPQSFE